MPPLRLEFVVGELPAGFDAFPTEARAVQGLSDG